MKMRILSFAALCWLAAAAAHAVTLLDLGLDSPPPLPAETDRAGSPYYITNFAHAAGADAAPTVTTFRVGAGSVVHVGYGPARVADHGIALTSLGDATVEGGLHLGKVATWGEPGLPDAATAAAVDFDVGGDLNVVGGDMTAAAGTSGTGVGVVVAGTARIRDGGSLALRGVDDTAMATLAADRLRMDDGGVLALDSYAVAATAGTTFAGPVESDLYSAVVGDGGALLLNGGVRPYDEFGVPDAMWVFRGLDVSAGGGGLLVERGGVLAAGLRGGVVRGSAVGQSLVVRRGGALDASLGTIQVQDMAGVALHGSYRAGYGSSGINLLDAADSRVDVFSGAELGLSHALQRHVNALPYTTLDNAGILRGGEIVFETGSAPVVRTGMGTYTLAVGAEALTGIDVLYVAGTENGVTGDESAGDRRQFRSNMQGLWRPDGMSAAQANIIYDLTVSGTPTVTATGAAGELNRQVLEAFVSGRGQAVGERGVADDGVFELYNGGAQFGVNSVAYGTASEAMSGLTRRVDFVADEMRRREGAASGFGWASYAIPEDYANRVWVGGFGRREEADLDYGIAGYEYKPGGLTIGYDRLYGDSLVLGGALAYGKGDYEDRAATANDSEITSYSLGAYVGYRRWTGFTASAYGGYSHLRNDLRDVRGGMRRRADFASHAWTLGGKLGYELCPADGLTAKPTVGLERIQAESRDHDERLDNLTVMRVGKVRRSSTLLPVDLALGFDLLRSEAALLRLDANVGYAYDFEPGGMEGTLVYNGLDNAGGVPVAERELGRHRFNFGAGLRFSGTKLDFGARYDYFKRDSYKAHQFRGNLGVKF